MSLLEQKDLSKHWLVFYVCLSWLYCLTLPSVVHLRPLCPCTYQNANLHAGGNWAFHSYIITCIRLIAIDGLQRGTRKPAWLTLTFQLAGGKADNVGSNLMSVLTMESFDSRIRDNKTNYVMALCSFGHSYSDTGYSFYAPHLSHSSHYEGHFIIACLFCILLLHLSVKVKRPEYSE